MFGVFYSGFSHCIASFPEVYVFIFCFLFFLVAFFSVTLFSLGGGEILENLIVMVAWCYILKIDDHPGDKGGDRKGTAVFVVC